MRKISSYLYPNRIELLADLAGFTTEYTNVYQRTVKIYQGVDNVLEFDIKNADQKRIELLTSPKITGIELNVMDASGTALPNSPYIVTPHPTIKGIATTVIPELDLVDLDRQFLRYSVTASDVDGNTIPLYADSRFGAVGTIELVGDAMPTFRDPVVYNTFTGEIDLNGNVINHSSAIPATFYEADITQTLDFIVKLDKFTGTIWLQGTTNNTISVDSFKYAIPTDITAPYVAASATTGELSMFTGIPIGEYKYFRICYQSLLTGTGASFDIERSSNAYSVTLVSGGSHYSVGSVIRILGSTLDGADGTNDLLITITAVDTNQLADTVQTISGFTFSGLAVGGTGTYSNKSGTIFAGKVVSISVE